MELIFPGLCVLVLIYVLSQMARCLVSGVPSNSTPSVPSNSKPVCDCGHPYCYHFPHTKMCMGESCRCVNYTPKTN
jgi:hypothetical protein